MPIILPKKMMIAGLLLGLVACSNQDNTQKTESAASTNEAASSAKATMSEADSSLLSMAQSVFKPLPSQDEINQKHPVTDAQISLGQKLYFDTRLSKNGNQSCNSCHNIASAGVDNLPLSPGSEFALGGRNSPTVFNAALQASQFWDGRAKDLKEQAGGPLLNPVEMGLPNEDAAVTIIKSIPTYVTEFAAAFPDAQDISFDQITTAIAAYEQTLITPSPWDDYLKGNVNALNTQQRTGLQKFMDNGCIACHTGVNLGGDSFQKFGLVDGPYWKFTGSLEKDDGRFQVTKAEDDRYMFRVPTLRNISKTYPYFHDGSIWSLSEAVSIMGQAQLGKQLPKEDIEDMVQFLIATNGNVSTQARTIPELPINGINTPKPALDKKTHTKP